MARPIKRGNDYFPFDVAIFSDRKLRILTARYGADGFMLYVYLLCEIYKEGYYLKVDDDFVFLLSAELHMSDEKISQMLNFLLERSLFNDKLFQSDKVLTSDGIQRRYQMMVKKKAEKNRVIVNEKYWLLSPADTSSYISCANSDSYSENNSDYSEKNSGNSENNDINKIKEKEIKLNKSNEKVLEGYSQFISPNYSPRVLDSLGFYLESGVSEVVVIKAIHIANDEGKKSLAYINGILKNCLQNNVFTMAEFENRKAKSEKKGKAHNYPERSYEEEDFKKIMKGLRGNG